MSRPNLRQSLTQGLIRVGLAATGLMPSACVWGLGRCVGGLASIALRRRLRANLRLALGEDVPPDAERAYFRRMGRWLGSMLRVYHRGAAGAGIARYVTFDESLVHLTNAYAGGRGVVLATPHMFCHELAGAIVNQRFPVVALIRKQKDDKRAKVKEHWYRALGLETVWRPRRATTCSDVTDVLRVLHDGKVLGITPDLLTGPEQGVAVTLFDRQVHLKPGAVALAMYGRAPLVSVWPQWINRTHGVLRFDPPVTFPLDGDRDETMRRGMQDWCDAFERHLRQHPEDWLFWLDKRWTRLLRGAPAASQRTRAVEEPA